MIVAACPTVAGPPSLTNLILKKDVLKPSVIVPAIAATVPTCAVRLDLARNDQYPGCGRPCRSDTGRTVTARPDTFRRQDRIQRARTA